MDLYSESKSTQGTDEELSCKLIIVHSDNEEDELKEYYSEPQTGAFDSTFMMLLEMEYAAAYPTEDSIDWDEDLLIFPAEPTVIEDFKEDMELKAFTAYKRAAQKVHPVSGTFPQEARVYHQFPRNPLDTLPLLPTNPPEFKPTERMTSGRMDSLNVNGVEFLSREEENLFKCILVMNETTFPFEEKDRGILRIQIILCQQYLTHLESTKIFLYLLE